LECLQNDLPPAGIKIGMLATAATVATVAEFLESHRGRRKRVPVVLDPVLRSSSGKELLDAQGIELLRERLLPQVDWITPNVEELGILSGQPSKRREDVPHAALALQGLGSGLNVVVTGGHMSPPDDLLLRAGEREALWLPGEMITSRSTHGTGCAFSSALLSRLVLGDTAQDAATMAKRYVSEAIRTATPMGKGWGPINHLWPLQED
jgi:hydroxymethylpyrimidine/phosphomethylpyrimidine kinase